MIDGRFFSVKCLRITRCNSCSFVNNGPKSVGVISVGLVDTAWWKSLWANFFNPETNEVVESPKLYLKLTKRCMEQVDGVFGLHGASLLKFNQEQCQYLVEKLKLALENANMVIEQIDHELSSSTSSKDMEQLLLIFKLLYSMGKEIEKFIQECCKETWIQSAVMLTNMSEHIVTIGFNLECCLNVFIKRKLETPARVGFCEIASLNKAQAEVVGERADNGKKRLMVDLQNVLQASTTHSVEHELAIYLFERLGTTKSLTYLHSFGSKERSILKMQKIIGIGSLAIVYKATWCGLEVAMKSFNGPGNEEFLQEVRLLEGLSHSNIVSLLWYTTDAGECHLIMELMDRNLGDLITKKMKENGHQGYPFSIPKALDLMLRIAK